MSGGRMGSCEASAARTLMAEYFTNECYYRIVVLGDPHLPTRVHRQVNKIIEAKNKVVEDINAWEDVNQISVVGDITARFGNKEEYCYARQYFAQFNKPISFIAGNHDYIFLDFVSPEGMLITGDAAAQEKKLRRFKATFGSLYYSYKVGRYLLIYLSPDKLNPYYLTQISEQQLEWFRNQLVKNFSEPTIVFFHAPLPGTLLSYSNNINTPNYIPQPRKAIEEIIDYNPQIILWISGHAHTSANNPSYASNINVYKGRIINIHNADMDRLMIWTNSLYLYPNRVVIKTFNHKKNIWETDLERVIYI